MSTDQHSEHCRHGENCARVIGPASNTPPSDATKHPREILPEEREEDAERFDGLG